MNNKEQRPEDAILSRLMGEVTEKLTSDLRDVLAAALEKQLSTALTQSLLESEFYRRISGDMRNGLKKIYKEINAASGEPTGDSSLAVADKARADKLFHEASEQLSAVLEQTQQATESIMGRIEEHMTLQDESAELIKHLRLGEASNHAEMDRLAAINEKLGEDLVSMMLSLSFQDLTGQRIQRAVTALKEIESTVVEMYLSTGLLIQAYEDEPSRGIDEIEEETRQKVSALKNPDSILESNLKGPSGGGSSQTQIDDLLSQLGM